MLFSQNNGVIGAQTQFNDIITSHKEYGFIIITDKHVEQDNCVIQFNVNLYGKLLDTVHKLW